MRVHCCGCVSYCVGPALAPVCDPDGYGTNLLYEKADLLYFVGALVYVLAAARDDGFYPDLRVFGLLWRYSGLAWVAESASSARCRCTVAPWCQGCLRKSGASTGSSSVSDAGLPEARALLG